MSIFKVQRSVSFEPTTIPLSPNLRDCKFICVIATVDLLIGESSGQLLRTQNREGSHP